MPQFTADPFAFPGLWDVVFAGGIMSPGVARLIAGGGREYAWDIRQAPGTQGYLMTYRGWKAGEDITFRFAFFEHPEGAPYKSTQSQVRSFYDVWSPMWSYDARKFRPTPTSVSHPSLNANDIENLVCKRIGPLENDEKGTWWIDQTFYEWRPPRIIPTETPKGATARLGVPTPQTKLQAEIAKEALLAQRPL